MSPATVTNVAIRPSDNQGTSDWLAIFFMLHPTRRIAQLIHLQVKDSPVDRSTSEGYIAQLVDLQVKDK